jgi:hypothetical protein
MAAGTIIHKPSPAKGIFSNLFGGGKNRADLRKAQAQFQKYMKEFKATEFQPLDLDKLRQENIFEERDLTKDVLPAYDYAQEAFIANQRRIQQATQESMIGGSGTAAVAQTLSQQGQQFAEKARVGLQTTLGGRTDLELREEARLRNLQTKYELANQTGASQFEQDKIATLLGVTGQQISGARQAIAANQSMWGQIIGGVASAVVAGSDRKLKKNINKIGESPSGLNIYSFEFKNSKYGEGLFQGVMSDEVPQEVVSQKDGYDAVDYSKLDVEFKQI